MKLQFLSVLLAAAVAGCCNCGESRLPEAKAVWPAGLEKEMNTLIAFRTDFEAAAGDDVKLDLVAWYSYRVTLNGAFVAFGPARGPKGFFRPDDLKLPAKDGKNDLQVEVVVRERFSGGSGETLDVKDIA